MTFHGFDDLQFILELEIIHLHEFVNPPFPEIKAEQSQREVSLLQFRHLQLTRFVSRSSEIIDQRC